ncbi:hypothetical protein NC652_035757 [Populus alba x Populus x berolinensis]|nr:hypothetical protein NC652_035757 [Populus alba x Populus x berolinensis]
MTEFVHQSATTERAKEGYEKEEQVMCIKDNPLKSIFNGSFETINVLQHVASTLVGVNTTTWALLIESSLDDNLLSWSCRILEHEKPATKDKMSKSPHSDFLGLEVKPPLALSDLLTAFPS